MLSVPAEFAGGMFSIAAMPFALASGIGTGLGVGPEGGAVAIGTPSCCCVTENGEELGMGTGVGLAVATGPGTETLPPPHAAKPAATRSMKPSPTTFRTFIGVCSTCPPFAARRALR